MFRLLFFIANKFFLFLFQTASYVVHIFPPCDFTIETLRMRHPEMAKRLGDYTHLFVVIATV